MSFTISSLTSTIIPSLSSSTTTPETFAVTGATSGVPTRMPTPQTSDSTAIASIPLFGTFQVQARSVLPTTQNPNSSTETERTIQAAQASLNPQTNQSQ